MAETNTPDSSKQVIDVNTPAFKERVKVRAYFDWQNHGETHGHDLPDYLAAEKIEKGTDPVKTILPADTGSNGINQEVPQLISDPINADVRAPVVPAYNRETFSRLEPFGPSKKENSNPNTSAHAAIADRLISERMALVSQDYDNPNPNDDQAINQLRGLKDDIIHAKRSGKEAAIERINKLRKDYFARVYPDVSSKARWTNAEFEAVNRFEATDPSLQELHKFIQGIDGQEAARAAEAQRLVVEAAKANAGTTTGELTGTAGEAGKHSPEDVAKATELRNLLNDRITELAGLGKQLGDTISQFPEDQREFIMQQIYQAGEDTLNKMSVEDGVKLMGDQKGMLSLYVDKAKELLEEKTRGTKIGEKLDGLGPDGKPLKEELIERRKTIKRNCFQKAYDVTKAAFGFVVAAPLLVFETDAIALVLAPTSVINKAGAFFERRSSVRIDAKRLEMTKVAKRGKNEKGYKALDSNAYEKLSQMAEQARRNAQEYSATSERIHARAEKARLITRYIINPIARKFYGGTDVIPPLFI